MNILTPPVPAHVKIEGRWVSIAFLTHDQLEQVARVWRHNLFAKANAIRLQQEAVKPDNEKAHTNRES